MFISHKKHTQRKINGSTSFAIDNMYYISFRIYKQESVHWCGEIQKQKIRNCVYASISHSLILSLEID